MKGIKEHAISSLVVGGARALCPISSQAPKQNRPSFLPHKVMHGHQWTSPLHLSATETNASLSVPQMRRYRNRSAFQQRHGRHATARLQLRSLRCATLRPLVLLHTFSPCKRGEYWLSRSAEGSSNRIFHFNASICF